MRNFSFRALGIVSVFLFACGGKSAGKNSTTGPIADPSTACADMASAFAQQMSHCTGISVTEAQSLMSATWDCAPLLASVSAGKISYDANQAGTCVDDINNSSCSSSDSPTSCSAAFAGTVAPGGTCKSDAECAQVGSKCEGTACAGTCVTPVAAGADCSSAPCQTGLYCHHNASGTPQKSCVAFESLNQSCSSFSCAKGLYCDSTTQTCLTPKTSGACSSSNECATNYVCTGPSSGSRTCQAQQGLNGACTPGEYQCSYGLYCSGTTCTEFSGPNGVCGQMSGGEWADCLNSWCNATTSTGTCQSYVAANGACDSSLYTGEPQCGPGMTCSNSSGPGTCVTTSCY
jgi:hypothetical protein